MLHVLELTLFIASSIITTLLAAYVMYAFSRKSVTNVVIKVLYIPLAFILLGIFAGPPSIVAAYIISSDWFVTWLRARRYGKKVAHHIGIGTNLLFTSIEAVSGAGSEIALIGALDKQETPVADAARILAPKIDEGLGLLEVRFGRQKNIDRARARISSFLTGRSAD